MSEAKHTPGPLMQYGQMIKDTAETVGGMFCIKQAVTNKRGVRVGTGDTLGYAYKREDAVLWAASTELLETCKSLLFYYENWRDKSPVGDTEKEDIESARAAIAKAEGR